MYFHSDLESRLEPSMYTYKTVVKHRISMLSRLQIHSYSTGLNRHYPEISETYQVLQIENSSIITASHIFNVIHIYRLCQILFNFPYYC